MQSFSFFAFAGGGYYLYLQNNRENQKTCRFNSQDISEKFNNITLRATRHAHDECFAFFVKKCDSVLYNVTTGEAVFKQKKDCSKDDDESIKVENYRNDLEKKECEGENQNFDFEKKRIFEK